MLARPRVFNGPCQTRITLFAKVPDGVGFGAGAVLLAKGDNAYGLNVVLHGSVEVVHRVAKPLLKSGRTDVTEKGGLPGECAVLDESPASANIRALRAGDLTCFPEGRIRDGAAARPGGLASTVYCRVSHVMVERLLTVGLGSPVLLNVTRRLGALEPEPTGKLATNAKVQRQRRGRQSHDKPARPAGSEAAD